ncbi:MAG: hypothetical protein ABIA74_04610 [bacterium]
MIIVLKTILLFLLIFFITPVVFFLIMGFFGGFFALEIDKNSWLAKTKIKWVKRLVHKYLS